MTGTGKDRQGAQERLDELGDQIEEARRTADEVIGRPSPDQDELYYESGDIRPGDDDQTAAPPG